VVGKPHAAGPYVRGPIPLSWLSKAGEIGGKALAVALAIRFHSGRQRYARTVAVSNELVEQFGVTRKSKYAALDALEEAGLIRVDQRPKKTPVVTIIDPDFHLDTSWD
jgi:hypothetical protein